MVAEIGVCLERHVARVSDLAERARHSSEIDLHRKGQFVRIVPAVVIMEMEGGESRAEGADHLRGGSTEPAHLSVPDIEARDEVGIVHSIKMREEIRGGRTGGKNGVIFF